MNSSNHGSFYALGGGIFPSHDANSMVIMLKSALNQYGAVSTLQIPKLRSSKFDILMALSDDLVKIDASIEGLGRRMSRVIGEMVTNRNKTIPSLEQREENLNRYQAIHLIGGEMSMDQYISSWQWNSDQYSPQLDLQAIVMRITSKIAKHDSTLKEYATHYNTLRTQLQSYLRKINANLMTRPLDGIIRPEHILQDSDFLQTVFLVIPTSQLSQFQNSYITFADEVPSQKPSQKSASSQTVPEKVTEPSQTEDSSNASVSSENATSSADRKKIDTPPVVPNTLAIIKQESDYTLVSIVVFKHKVNQVNSAARLKSWAVRHFQYVPDAEAQNAEILEDITSAESVAFDSFLNWASSTFGDIFQASIHIKALRVHVDSLLRFGEREKYFAALIKPTKSSDKSDKKIKTILMELFGGTEQPTSQADVDTSFVLPNISSSEILPYVYISIRDDWDKTK